MSEPWYTCKGGNQFANILSYQHSAGPVSVGDTAMAEAQDVIQPEAMDTETQQGDVALAGPSGANSPPTADPSGGDEGAIAQLGFAVQFIVQGLRNGAGPTLMPLLVQLLPYLLKTQVCPQRSQLCLVQRAS